jgi:hypothetical protein
MSDISTGRIRPRDPPEDFQRQLRAERRLEQIGAKALVEACQSGDAERFQAATAFLADCGGWTRAFRRLARAKLDSVSEQIKHEFQLRWFESKGLAVRCDDKPALLAGLRLLFIPYQGPAVRLFRGAAAHEARARKFYGPSWTTDIDEADGFARQYQYKTGGSVVLETLASPEAIISAPGSTGAYWSNLDGERRYDEQEYIVDGRLLQQVTVARRYPQISLDEFTNRENEKAEPSTS